MKTIRKYLHGGIDWHDRDNPFVLIEELKAELNFAVQFPEEAVTKLLVLADDLLPKDLSTTSFYLLLKVNNIYNRAHLIASILNVKLEKDFWAKALGIKYRIAVKSIEREHSIETLKFGYYAIWAGCATPRIAEIIDDCYIMVKDLHNEILEEQSELLSEIERDEEDIPTI